MNEVALPPSPNWYLSNILACSRRGTVAWGAKNFIVIARQKEDNNILQYSIIKDHFRDKVSALVFCSKFDDSDSSELLISSIDDKVKIWDVDTLDLIMEFSFDYGDKPIVGVDWSAKDKLVCAVNSEGFLMYCNIYFETIEIISLCKLITGKLTPTCLACCPHESNLIAIGAKSGLIYIVQKETILYKMRGHNEEIVSLSWCPSDMNVLNGSDKRDLLLASGAKDRSVFIWRAGRDGRYETIINLPSVPLTGSFQHKSKLGTMTGTWITVCWVKPKILLTSSLWGELLSWDLSINKPVHRLFHAYHSRGLFCIAAKNDAISDNWRTDSDFTVWTLAQDRWIICCKQNSDPAKPGILKHKIPTQGGYVYCMGACPIDTSRIAFGVGDAMLRLWNLSEPHATTFDVTIHWQKIKGKIRAISWFPADESTVAFGTAEGRVGVFDAIGTYNKPPILYRQYHRDTIYKLEWAQLEQDYFLFSCAERELIAYKKSAPNNEPMSIIKKGCTEFSWKSNLCLAVALENGSITFYDQKLRKRGNTVHISKSTVNCLAWHPESTATDKWTSLTANYLAIASDSHSVIIIDMSELIKELETTDTKDYIENRDDNQERKVYKIVATLTGHTEKVVCLAWSPHFSGHLVSGSYDNTAQVWNVEKQELMGTFVGHEGPVLCCMWSPLKPQLIMTGSSDFMLRIWDYTSLAQSPKQSSDIKATKKKYKQQKTQKKLPKNKTDNLEVQNVSSTTSNLVNQSAETINPKLQASVTKKKEKKSYFNRYNKIVYNDKFKILNFIKNDIRKNQTQIEDDAIANLSLFCEKRHNLLALISQEKSTQDNSNAITEMNMWCDDLQNNLIMAIKDQQLNDFLISLAPSISMKMWKDVCEAYAHQLIRQGNVEKAVSYLLCIHKVYEAIEAFLSAKMFKEAYVLARCRLDADDPFLKNILGSWAEWAVSNGQLEQAAHCHVKLEQFDKAAKILARRRNADCLEVASELAFLSGDEGYGIFLAVDAMTHALLKSDYIKARSYIANIRQIQYLNVHIDVHEAIMSTYQKQTELDTMKTWFEEKQSHGLLQDFEGKYDASYYDALCKNANTNATPKDEINDAVMRLNTSYQIATAVMCDMQEIRLKHLTTTLGDMFEYEKATKQGTLKNEGFFTHILMKLDTKRPMDENSIYAKSNYPVSQSIRAYLCIGLLNWLLNYLEHLSIEEETRFIQLILDLLNDVINETTLSYQEKICKLDQLENQLVTLLFQSEDKTENDNYKRAKEEIKRLKSDKSKFAEERVCMPDPSIIFHKTCLVTNKLHDDINKFRLLHFLNNLIKIKEIKLSELDLLKELEDISHKVDKNMHL